MQRGYNRDSRLATIAGFLMGIGFALPFELLFAIIAGKAHNRLILGCTVMCAVGITGIGWGIWLQSYSSHKLSGFARITRSRKREEVNRNDNRETNLMSFGWIIRALGIFVLMGVWLVVFVKFTQGNPINFMIASYFMLGAIFLMLLGYCLRKWGIHRRG